VTQVTNMARRIVELEEALERANVVLNEALDIIVWMSGSDDFSPEGKAYSGWVAARARLDALAAAARKAES
jgi:hypothetical protein